MRIEIIENKNFHITFDNGVTVSILIGYGSYSDNHGEGLEYIDKIGTEKSEHSIVSSCAELAAWASDGEFITEKLSPRAHGDVMGWQDTEDILKFLNSAAKYKSNGS